MGKEKWKRTERLPKPKNVKKKNFNFGIHFECKMGIFSSCLASVFLAAPCMLNPNNIGWATECGSWKLGWKRRRGRGRGGEKGEEGRAGELRACLWKAEQDGGQMTLSWPRPAHRGVLLSLISPLLRFPSRFLQFPPSFPLISSSFLFYSLRYPLDSSGFCQFPLFPFPFFIFFPVTFPLPSEISTPARKKNRDYYDSSSSSSRSDD